MSDHIKGFVVTLDESCHQNVANRIAGAIRMIKGVSAVTESVDDYSDVMNRMRVRQELSEKLMSVIYPDINKSKP